MDVGAFLQERYLQDGDLLTAGDFVHAVEIIQKEIDAFIEAIGQVEEEEAHMGAFDSKPNITIPNPNGGPASKEFRKKQGEQATAEQEFRVKWGWDAHEQVIIRGQFTAAMQEQMENASSVLEGKGKSAKFKVQTGSARRKLLELMIVDWTLTQNGRPVPVDAESIGALPANYRTPVLEMCDEIAMTMDEDEQENFPPGANGPTKESSHQTK